MDKPELIKMTSEKIGGPVTSNGAGTNEGYGMDCGKKGNPGMMNAKEFIKTSFITQVPSAGTDAGKSGTGKTVQGKDGMFSVGTVSPSGDYAGK